MKIVFATHNSEKLKEVQAVLPTSIKVLSLNDINCTEEILETGETLEDNAVLKANYVTKQYGYDCFADDTGLEVEALNGLPGVYSARYAGEHSNAEKNMNKLLNAMRNSPNRLAQFRTVIVLNFQGKTYEFEGVCKGEILENRSGEKGFGYDPIFKPLVSNQSFASMTLKEKNKISHRGLAMKQLVNFLKKQGASH
ncbi:non-canonical purine NTP diphosphatase [Flavobacteriaceae bacterium F08102]|nr:non-canonical purine NTP diphosphatase [Flavobacteriaceae bacterium F08102]